MASMLLMGLGNAGPGTPIPPPSGGPALQFNVASNSMYLGMGF